MWKENIMENLEGRSLSYAIVGEFLSNLKEKFDKGDDKTIKIVELKKLEHESKTMEEFIQEFRRVARGVDMKNGH